VIAPSKRSLQDVTCGVDHQARRRPSGFTLAEVVISLAIMGLVFGGILLAYVQSAKRAEWSGHDLAAQAFAIQQLEQARAAVWDTSTNQITNLNIVNWTAANAYCWGGYTWDTLDVPYSGTNFVRATNYVMLTNITVNASPLVTIWMIRVQTVWRQRGILYTNTMANYFARDQ